MGTFSITQYAPDGEILGQADMTIDQLSTRWLCVCHDLIDAAGPVFDRSMGSTLERFSIECTGAICRFKVNGVVLFSAVMLTSVADAHFQQTLSYFATQLDPASPFEVPARFPAVLVLNTFASGINESDATALFQLVYHFAGAYFSWSGG
jgi:hypothetical protein